jgi:hypothetical protein
MVGYCKCTVFHCFVISLTRHRYIGAEDGIHEYHVNIQARKMFPSLVLR